MASANITFHFIAQTIEDAMTKATEKWRMATGDPEAKLPWQAHFEIDDVVTESGAGEVVSMQLDVTVHISASAKDIGVELKTPGDAPA